MLFCFFFNQKAAYEMRISDWSSDVCSSDLELEIRINDGEPLRRPHRDQFPAKANEDGHISECELLTFEDRDGGVAAVGWIVHHDYLGALPRRTRIGGIRLRAGAIQVRDHNALIAY